MLDRNDAASGLRFRLWSIMATKRLLTSVATTAR